MSFMDIFKGKQYKAALEALQQQHADLQALMTPEMQDAFALQNKIRELEGNVRSKEHEIVSKVTYTNFDASLGRIYKSAEAISKLGTIMNIRI